MLTSFEKWSNQKKMYENQSSEGGFFASSLITVPSERSNAAWVTFFLAKNLDGTMGICRYFIIVNMNRQLKNTNPAPDLRDRYVLCKKRL